MNSCRSRLLFAWAPPLITFIIGTGKRIGADPPRYRYSGSPDSSAAAFAVATDTASSAFAPSRALLSVPSRSISVWSMNACSSASRPMIASQISVLTFSTAWSTPLPRYRCGSPSRSSIASRCPVDAPDGTAARPMTPDSRSTSASTVGLPRESRISRATTSTIALIVQLQLVLGVFNLGPRRARPRRNPRASRARRCASGFPAGPSFSGAARRWVHPKAHAPDRGGSP